MKKYNLGDTVYFMTDNKIAKGEIILVQTIEQKRKFEYDGFQVTNDPTFGLKEVKTTYSVSIHQGRIVKPDTPENILFPTMEELFENLKITSI